MFMSNVGRAYRQPTLSAVLLVAASLMFAGGVAADDMASNPMVFDGHNDLPWQYRKRFDNRLDELDVAQPAPEMDPPLHTDFPRLKAGGVGAQFWSVYVPIDSYGGSPGDAAKVLEQMDVDASHIAGKLLEVDSPSPLRVAVLQHGSDFGERSVGH